MLFLSKDKDIKIFLYNYAYIVRETIEQIKKTNKKMFIDFPIGYCNKASIWLYEYFRLKGINGIEIRMKDPFIESVDGNHCWLFVLGYNVDITCDQFNQINNLHFEKVIVEKCGLYGAGYEIHTFEEQYGLEYYNPMRLLEEPYVLKEKDMLYEKLGIK